MPNSANQVFLSYSRNDLAAANALRQALVQAGLAVFKDVASLRGGDRWLGRLQDAVSNCGAFVVLVGHDGVRRWVGAEVEVAIARHLSPHLDDDRLPIFPVLLPEAPFRGAGHDRQCVGMGRGRNGPIDTPAANEPRHAGQGGTVPCVARRGLGRQSEPLSRGHPRGF